MTTLPLSSITRISPLNPRHDMQSDVSSLAATIMACGLIDPIVVWPRPGARGEYEVLSGGRRWRALGEILRDACELTTIDLGAVPVEVHEGDEASALRLALAAAVTPRPQHPVDEFEAFAKLAEKGFAITDIARDFGETERHVRQRLALAALAPRVRDMWRKGEIAREAAEAYTIAPLAAQEALLDDWAQRAPGKIKDAFSIRAALRGDMMVASEPVAKFLCADLSRLAVYRDRGGRVLEDLFSEQPGLQDPAIARRVASDLLREEAQVIAEAEGWGHAFGGEEEGGFQEDLLSTEDEERLDEITQELAGECSKAKRKKLLAERYTIMGMVNDRAAYGVRADLDHEGTIYFTRGVALPDEAATTPGGEADPPPGESGEELLPSPEAGEESEGEDASDAAPKPLGEPGKQLLAVIHAGATAALRDTVQSRPDIALMFAVAALGCSNSVIGFTALRPVLSNEPEDNALLKRIRPLYFANALAECASASTNDLTVALARIVAAAIETEGLLPANIGSLFQAIAARGGDVTDAISRAIDRRSFFEAAEKERTLRMIGALIGPAEAARAGRMKKDKLAAHAATLSKEKGHLPPPFGDWVSFPTRPGALDEAIYSDEETPLAQAMQAAIDKDEANWEQPSSGGGKGKTKTTKSAPSDPFEAKIASACSAYPNLGAFLRHHVHFGNEALSAGRVKASGLYEAYAAFCQANGNDPASLTEFGNAIAALGVEKKRFKNGVHYLNVALRDAGDSNIGEAA